MIYKFTFTWDYHTKEDGTHDIKLIQMDLEWNETAFAEWDEIPYYGTECTEEEVAIVNEVISNNII